MYLLAVESDVDPPSQIDLPFNLRTLTRNMSRSGCVPVQSRQTKVKPRGWRTLNQITQHRGI